MEENNRRVSTERLSEHIMVSLPEATNGLTISPSDTEDDVLISGVELCQEYTNQVNFEVLHPENPSMVRFQAALKRQLECKLAVVQDDIMQMEGEIKKIRSENKNVSEILFVQKREVKKMEKMLYEYNESVSHLIMTKQLMRNELADLQKVHKNEMTAYQNENRSNVEIRRKLSVQRRILKELQNYDRNQVSSLFIKRNLVTKNKTDKDVKLREKNKQDYLLMKLENEVFKFDLLLRQCENQLNVECDELMMLREKVTTKTFDFTNISQENSHLLKLCKQIIFLISNRDETYSILKNELENCEIFHKTKTAELNSYKRDLQEQLLSSESIVSDRLKNQRILNRLRQEFCDMQQREKLTEDELIEVASMIECTEKNMKCALEEHVEYKRSLSIVEVKLKNFSSKKYELEERILSQLRNELTSSNVSSKLNEEILKLRDTTKSQEMVIKELQKNYSNKLAYLKKQKVLLDADYELLRNLKMEIDLLSEKEFNRKEELNKLKVLVKEQNHMLDQEQKCLHALKEQPIQDSDLPAQLNHIKEKIQKTDKTIECEKRIWIRKQNEAMMKIEKKSQLTSELNSVRSHVYLLQQKLSRLNQDISKAEKERHNFDKSVAQILRKISSLNDEYSNQKKSENTLDDENCTIHNAVLEKLKAAEIDSMQLVSELEKLNEKKETLEKVLLNSQREDLEWQKKVQLVQEMKESISKELSENGDIGAMKNEIHRMEIRYGQLRRAQDSLVSDLESNVHKRDRIIDAVIVKDETILRDETKNQRLMTQKIEIINNKNKKLSKKIEDCRNECSNLSNTRNQIIVEINGYEGSLKTLKDSIQELESKTLEHFLLKQKNLEILIRKQKLADFFWHFKTDKLKFAVPNEFAVEKLLAKHQYLKTDLNHILENLCKDFPSLMTFFIRIINVLNSSSGVIN